MCIRDSTHTAWLVESEAELHAWKQKLQDAGLDVSVETRHEVIESIYVRDPNGYFIEFLSLIHIFTSSTSLTISGSSAEVGSSNSMILWLMHNERAIACLLYTSRCV